ncbi:MAG: hypothetical protein ACRCYV_04070 [Aeromonas sp.]
MARKHRLVLGRARGALLDFAPQPPRGQGTLEFYARRSGASLEFIRLPQAERVAAVLQGRSAAARLDVACIIGRPPLAVTWRSSTTPAQLHGRTIVVASGRLHGLVDLATALLRAAHDINVDRGPKQRLLSRVRVPPQQAPNHQSRWQNSAQLRQTLRQLPQPAQSLAKNHQQQTRPFARSATLHAGVFSAALNHLSRIADAWYDLPTMRSQAHVCYVNGMVCQHTAASSYRHPEYSAKTWAMGWRPAPAFSAWLTALGWERATPADRVWDTHYEEAIWPPYGQSPLPEPPIIPARPDRRRLKLAFNRRRGTAELEFAYADAAHIIPSKKVYFVENSVRLMRLSDGRDIPTTRLQIEVDSDSWAWQFSAEIIERIDLGGEWLALQINGHTWHCLCDGWQQTEQFNQRSVLIHGRGLSAELSPTHMLPLSISVTAPAQLSQLAADLLPVGWTLDWQAADWLVPAGFFSLDNQTPIEAIAYLAQAAAASVLPDNMQRHLRVLPRYSVLPWELGESTLDVLMPRAVLTQRSHEQQPQRAANGVYVSGVEQGIHALVKRRGSAGELLAQTISHPLVCDVAAARALGSAALADSMPRGTQRLDLPLSADTGLLLPGQLVGVSADLDHPAWRGYTRSVSVTAALNGRAVSVRQQVEVLTYQEGA